jgi:hypothetical protein
MMNDNEMNNILEEFFINSNYSLEEKQELSLFIDGILLNEVSEGF